MLAALDQARKHSENSIGHEKKAARKHSVKAALNVIELTKAGTALTLEIFSDSEKIGTIVIGRGSLEWTGGKRQKRKRIGWARFASMMDELAYGS